MNAQEASDKITDLLADNRSLLFMTSPDAPDFTSSTPFKMILVGKNSCVTFDVEAKDLAQLTALFDATVFDPERVDRLYAWNFKAFCSFVHYVTGRYVDPKCNVFDLQILEAFADKRLRQPVTLAEAVGRMKDCMAYKGWQKLYKTLYMPLATKVLPSIEATPLLNETTKQAEHPYYEIEGQVTGRMNCSKKFSRCYLPHNMGADVRSAMKPRGYGKIFMTSDFRHCEVTVLQLLTGDPVLGRVLEQGGDLHEKIYEILTEDVCNTEKKRDISKKLFIPVMWGLGAEGLAHQIGLPVPVATELVGRIKSKFSVACDWMQERQEAARKGPVEDFIGRPRTYPEAKSYLVRGCSVQGVAATACQEKLVQLHEALDGEKVRLAFSVHDGYGFVIQTSHAREAYNLVKSVCESESTLIPGLRMKCQIKFGGKLSEAKVLWRD